ARSASHSLPTRRSSDLVGRTGADRRGGHARACAGAARGHAGREAGLMAARAPRRMLAAILLTQAALYLAWFWGDRHMLAALLVLNRKSTRLNSSHVKIS